jgi:hypothetical protein
MLGSKSFHDNKQAPDFDSIHMYLNWLYVAVSLPLRRFLIVPALLPPNGLLQKNFFCPDIIK